MSSTFRIRDPIMEVREAIPELIEINHTPNSLVYLSSDQWDSRMKTIETKNLKQYHRSTSWVSLNSWFHDCIVEIMDGTTFLVNKDRYKLIRKYVMSEEFNKT